jgi:hypothetical protein
VNASEAILIRLTASGQGLTKIGSVWNNLSLVALTGPNENSGNRERFTASGLPQAVRREVCRGHTVEKKPGVSCTLPPAPGFFLPGGFDAMLS